MIQSKTFMAVMALLLIGMPPVQARTSRALQCQKKDPVKINVVPRSQKVRFDYSRTLAQIQNVATDTKNPYGFHKTTYTQGFMQGTIKVKPVIKLGGYTVQPYNMACIWYDSIDIDIEIIPKIFIAKEVNEDPCMRGAVTHHEMKHVDVDRRVVNAYAESIGNKLYDRLKKRGFMVGPVPASKKDIVMKRMMDAAKQILSHEYERMEFERRDAQTGVDTLEEYERVSAQCPAFKRSKAVRNFRQNQ